MKKIGIVGGIAWQSGIEATGRRDRKARNLIVDLIAELQLGKHDGFAERIGSIARR